MGFVQLLFVSNLSLTYICVISNASQNQETKAEDAAQVLEHFVDGTSCTNTYPSALLEPTSSLVTPDYPNMYWLINNDSQKQYEKFALIREIVDAMPELDMVRLLFEVFDTRCLGPLDNFVYTPTFMKQAEIFCGCLGIASPEVQVMTLSSTIPMDTLACHLLAVSMPLYRASGVCSRSRFLQLVLALAFHPTSSILGWSPTSLALRVEEL